MINQLFSSWGPYEWVGHDLEDLWVKGIRPNLV